MRRVELLRASRRRQSVVQQPLQTVNLVLAGLQVVPRPVLVSENAQKSTAGDAQLEKRVGDLQHEYMRVPVVVDDEDALDGAPHSKVFIVILQPLQARRHRRVLLWLRLLRAEREIGERVQINGRRHRGRR